MKDYRIIAILQKETDFFTQTEWVNLMILCFIELGDIKLTLDDIQREVIKLAEKIAAPLNYIPTFGHTVDFARPHIEVDEAGYHYKVIERGRELEHKTTLNFKELLFWIFSDTTFSMASNYAANSGGLGKDSRRILFAKQVELIGMIDPDFAEQVELEHKEILKDHPFDDDAVLRILNKKRG